MAEYTRKKRKLEIEPEIIKPKRRRSSAGASKGSPATGSNGIVAAVPQFPVDNPTHNGSAKKTETSSKDETLGDFEAPSGNNVEESSVAQSTPAETMETKTRKNSKGRESHQVRQVEEEEHVSDEIVVAIERPAMTVDKAQRSLEKKARRKAARERLNEDGETTLASTNGWQLSLPGAGRFLDHDSIFVLDENDGECLLAATARQIQLLSLESSLLVRSHDVPDGLSIICFSRSPNTPHSVDIAYDNGSKVTWNWITSATLQGTFPGQETAFAMATAVLSDKSSELYYITHSGSDYSIVGERRALYTTQRMLRSIQVLHEGAFIVCRSATAVIIGARKEPIAQSEYTWIELPSSVPNRCVEARLIFRSSSKKQQSKRPELAVAIGDVEGKIHLYSDLNSVFASKTKAELPAPRILHWHREPVSAVKFSRDGTYLISGGKETVLVLWQLDTGKRQFLPHLTAEIERIVLNAEGTRYALQMGDNSIVVLSTSELKPVANFAGLQLPIWTEQMAAIGIVVPKVNAILHPQNPHQLLLSVPATQPKTSRDVTTRPFLQAFDVRNCRHISRQALARNNVTDFNVGPEQMPIIPPDITRLAISADGKWLATVDEWVQPGIDLEHVVSGASPSEIQHVRSQQEARHESHLKFWRWDDPRNLWTLSTRADAPHNRTIVGELMAGQGRVLKLVSDPATNSFATIGQDSNVKIWRPRMRTRHGIAIKEVDGTDAIEWVCKRTVPFLLPEKVPTRAASPMGDPETQDVVHNAYLAYSPDGSMLAGAQVSLINTPCTLVHFISTMTGTVVSSKAGLIPPEQELVDMAFVDRYFIALTTESVRIWDLVEDKHLQTRRFAGNPAEQDDPMLAVNHTEGTVAVISYEPVHGSETAIAKVQICDPKQPVALFETHLSAKPGALLGENGGRGYTILFEDATIRKLSSAISTNISKESSLQSLDSSSVPGEVALTHDEDVELSNEDKGSKPLALNVDEYSIVGEYSTVGDGVEDRPVVRPEQLASIFDASQSFAMPPVREMFQAVVELFGKKPLSHVGEDKMDIVEFEA